MNPDQLSDYPACPTIQPVRLSDRTVCQTRPFWSWPSQPREINTGTMTSGSGGAKFATGEDLRGTSLCGRIFPALVEISRMKPNLWFQMGFTFLQYEEPLQVLWLQSIPALHEGELCLYITRVPVFDILTFTPKSEAGSRLPIASFYKFASLFNTSSTKMYHPN